MRDEGFPTRFEGVGLSFEWPDVKGHERSPNCEQGKGGAGAAHAFTSYGVGILPSQAKGVERPDLVVSGSTGPGVHRVRVVYTDRHGDRQELPVDFARAEDELRELAHRSRALGTFVAFMPGDWAARDELESRFDLHALYGTSKFKPGPLARRERTLALRAYKLCRSKKPNLDSLDTRDQEAIERAYRPHRTCLEQHQPPSPIEYIAYDEQGRKLERITEPLIAYVTPTSPVQQPAGHERPGDKRGRRPVEKGYDKPVVLLRGRAPDGALYELFAALYKHHGRVSGNCIILWWPYVRHADGGGLRCI